MRVAVKNHALPVYKKNRIAPLLCIFESTISHVSLFVGNKNSAPDPNSAAYEHMGGSRGGDRGSGPP